MVKEVSMHPILLTAHFILSYWLLVLLSAHLLWYLAGILTAACLLTWIIVHLKPNLFQKWKKPQQSFAQILAYSTYGESLILERKISHFSLVHTILFLELIIFLFQISS